MFGHRSFSGACWKEAIYYISSTFRVEASTDCMTFVVTQSLHAKLCDITSLMLAESTKCELNWLEYNQPRSTTNIKTQVSKQSILIYSMLMLIYVSSFIVAFLSGFPVVVGCKTVRNHANRFVFFERLWWRKLVLILNLELKWWK